MYVILTVFGNLLKKMIEVGSRRNCKDRRKAE
jgi:hypothetical protein